MFLHVFAVHPILGDTVSSLLAHQKLAPQDRDNVSTEQLLELSTKLRQPNSKNPLTEQQVVSVLHDVRNASNFHVFLATILLPEVDRLLAAVWEGRGMIEHLKQRVEQLILRVGIRNKIYS